MKTGTFWYIVAFEGARRLYRCDTGFATKADAENEAEAKSLFAMMVPGCKQTYRVEPVEFRQ